MGIFWSEFVLLFNTNPALITLCWTVISFGIGLWYGDKKAISRYRLDKFNAISDPIELFLNAELERLKQGKVMLIRKQFDFDELSLHLQHRKRRAYKQALNDYFSALHTSSETTRSGQVIVKSDIPAAIKAVEKLLTFAKHR
ncbi:L13 [Kosakonia radicincitans]|nr:L13 [Kosakonia radicincitans]